MGFVFGAMPEEFLLRPAGLGSNLGQESAAGDSLFSYRYHVFQADDSSMEYILRMGVRTDISISISSISSTVTGGKRESCVEAEIAMSLDHFIEGLCGFKTPDASPQLAILFQGDKSPERLP